MSPDPAPRRPAGPAPAADQKPAAPQSPLGMAMEQLRKVAGQVAEALKAGPIAQLDRLAGLSGKAADAVTRPFTEMGQKLAGVLTVLAKPFGMLQDAIGRVSNSIGSLVREANPASFMRFQLAVADLNATVGRSLTPVLDAATAAVRAVGGALNAAAPAFDGLVAPFRGGEFQQVVKVFGETLSGVLGAVGKAASALMPVFEPIVKLFGERMERLATWVEWVAELVEDIAPIIGEVVELLAATSQVLRPVFDLFNDLFRTVIGEAVRFVAPIVGALAEVLTRLATAVRAAMEWVTDFIRRILALLGVQIEVRERPTGEVKDNTGMAARQATWSDPAAVLKQAMAQAAMAGKGAAKPEEVTAKRTTDIDVKLSGIAKAVMQIADWAAGFFERIGAALKPVWDAVTGAVLKLAGWAGDFFRNLWENLAKLADRIGQFFTDLPRRLYDAITGRDTSTKEVKPGDRLAGGGKAMDFKEFNERKRRGEYVFDEKSQTFKANPDYKPPTQPNAPTAPTATPTGPTPRAGTAGQQAPATVTLDAASVSLLAAALGRAVGGGGTNPGAVGTTAADRLRSLFG